MLAVLALLASVAQAAPPQTKAAVHRADATLAQRADSTWRDHDRAGREARNRGDWKSAKVHYAQMDTLLGGHSTVAQAVARASWQSGDTAGAIRELERVARAGVIYDIATDSLIRGAAALVPDLARRLRENAKTIGTVNTFATMPRKDFVEEGVAYDPIGKRYFASSIRLGRVMQVSSNGAVSEYADLVKDGGWGGLGMAVDAKRNRLWVATKWYPRDGASSADSGRSGVHLYDLARGSLLKRFELPRGAHEPGDICASPNGDLFVSDGREGSIRSIRNGADSLEMLVAPGALVSPQGCAVDSRTGRLLVADYVLGIISIDVRSGAWKRVPRPMDIAVTGIDGLVLHGDLLIGVQNGVQPQRVLMVQLDELHNAITAACVLAQDAERMKEPTHLVVSGADIVFVMNSGFPNYDDAGKLKDGAVEDASRLGRVALKNRC